MPRGKTLTAYWFGRVPLGWWLVVALGYSALLFSVGSLPNNGGLPTPSDKLLHFSAFGVQTLLALPAALKFAGKPRRAVLLAVGYGIAAGGFLEVWQSFIPDRDAEWGDFFADALGAVGFGGIVLALFSLLGAQER